MAKCNTAADASTDSIPAVSVSVPSACNMITNETEAVGDKRFVYENAHVIVTDPIFKSDRCLENALKSEVRAQFLGAYLKTVQKDITPPMRKIVAEWMMEVCAEEKCQEEVVLLAINYMDRFLSTKSVRKTHLQILAAACLLVASKIREPTCRALSAELLVFYTDNSIYKDDLIKWELRSAIVLVASWCGAYAQWRAANRR
ncbi:G1/S-specific cyclin-D2, partial [Drosophila montana]|uniref:G1/S-specific cyclin-D2 n=1 Tax=Drosophila montana TaxID=40370 RepID=UPI00313EEB91